MSDTRKEVFKKIHERCFQFGSCNYKETGCSDCPINVVLVKAETLLDKEEQGLLISLPCKVGDTVYQLLLTGIKNHELEYGIFEAKVTRFIQDSFYLCVEMVATDESKRILELTTGAFGKTVFLTEAEAEEVLAKMGGK